MEKKIEYPKPGDKFEEWTVVGETVCKNIQSKETGHWRTRSYTPCQCSCGAFHSVGLHALKSGRSPKCAACSREARGLTSRYTAHGKTLTIAQWLEEPECMAETRNQLYHRFNKMGITPEEALAINKSRKHRTVEQKNPDVEQQDLGLPKTDVVVPVKPDEPYVTISRIVSPTTSMAAQEQVVGLREFDDKDGLLLRAEIGFNRNNPSAIIHVSRYDVLGQEYKSRYLIDVAMIADHFLYDLATKPIRDYKSEWRQAVASGETDMGYAAWVAVAQDEDFLNIKPEEGDWE